MGFRFSKRVSLGKGLGLNIGKRKVSLSHRSRHGSIGTSGFSINIPGSGISYRSKWASTGRRTRRKGRSSWPALILIGFILWIVSPTYALIFGVAIVCIVLLFLLFSSTATHSDKDIQAIARCAARMVDVVNESKDLAKSSENPATRISRLQVARDNLARLKKMIAEYGFLKLPALPEVEQELDEIALSLEQGGYREAAEGNERAQNLEKAGDVDGAIEVYERLVARAVDTPFCYRRLAIIYRKKRMLDDELRVLKKAIECVPVKNERHHAWFEDRHKSVLVKMGRS